MSNKIAFLGCGSMGAAIMSGLLASGIDTGLVTATVRTPEKAALLKTLYGVNVMAIGELPNANRDAARVSDIVILGTKPYGIADLASEISDSLTRETLVISIAAAVSLQSVADSLPSGQPAIRAIPNTPLKVRRGVVGLTAGPHATPEHMRKAASVFECSGIVLEIPEEQQDLVSAISGSGPAYAFYLTEALATAAEKLGLDSNTAEILARQTMAGAGILLTQPNANARLLRRAVTSPNGTTERAIAVFEKRGLDAILTEGAEAAAARAGEIAMEIERGSPFS